MKLMRITDFFRELFCKHEWDYSGEYIDHSVYDERHGVEINILCNKKFCLKCGKII